MAWDWIPATRGDLKELENRVMKLEDALKQIKADSARIKTSVANILADEKRQDDKIAELQSELNKGILTPEQQALLDEVVGMSSANTASVEALADSIPEPPAVTTSESAPGSTTIRAGRE